MARKKATPADAAKSVESITHEADKRRNIPTAEYQAVVDPQAQHPVRVAYERRNRDLDPQLVWRGKDERDWSDLVVHAPPIYIQEKIHPKVLVDDLLRQSAAEKADAGQGETGKGRAQQLDLFSDFNGIPAGADKTDFYQHDQNWSNRMILGDSLQVMASLADREGLRGKVQCIYFDPPYGIKFNSNFQWSTTSRDVKDGKLDHVTREPEQVKAFRDTWRDGIHSYLTYLRDRLTVARDLLTDSGSIFVQIGDENVHRVRAVMDEVFGDENFVTEVAFKKTAGQSSQVMSGTLDYLLIYARRKKQIKFRALYRLKEMGGAGSGKYQYQARADGTFCRLSADKLTQLNDQETSSLFAIDTLVSQRPRQDADLQEFDFEGVKYSPGKGTFKSNLKGLTALKKANRLTGSGKALMYRRFLGDFPAFPVSNLWEDTSSGASTTDPKVYVVQTSTKVVERCILMATDPGDLVLDPTCGSGTTAMAAEEWGRRWIAIDTSRVALALARARIMGARYPYYLLADSKDGQQKSSEIVGAEVSTQPVQGNVRQGFVYQRVPHITLKSIANNSEIDVAWEKWQAKLEPLREKLNKALKTKWEEWEIPREADPTWSETAGKLHADWWKARIGRQKEIDASIAARAEFEYLYDKPYEDKKKVRVAGPFTVESLSPHRMLGVDENDELIDPLQPKKGSPAAGKSFPEMVLDNLRTAGVQQAHKDDRIVFTSLIPWPGELVCAEGKYQEGDTERRAAILIGPEFGTVQRADLAAAAREAAESRFDVLIACAFNYEAHTTDFTKLGRVPILKARMNADLHMSDDLKNTGKGNLFVIFGEPDITLLTDPDGRYRIKVNGVDVFEPSTGEVRSDSADGIACWFLDTDYNEESFFVRHAYFLGANDPYSALRTTLKAEINPEAWGTLHSDTSRPFDKPQHGRVAVKVINHLGDEVMKVFKV